MFAIVAFDSGFGDQFETTFSQFQKSQGISFDEHYMDFTLYQAFVTLEDDSLSPAVLFKDSP